jgi:hypothetical protein
VLSTFSITTLCIIVLSISTFKITTLGKEAFSIMTHSITTFRIAILSMKGNLTVTLYMT